MLRYSALPTLFYFCVDGTQSFGIFEDARPAHVGFVADKVALEQVFLRELHFSRVTIILSLLRTHSSITDAV